MRTLAIVCILAVTLGACANARDTRMADGAVLGGAGGALIGGIAGRSVGGAVIGGVAGAAAGAIIADATRPSHRGTYCYDSESLHKRICRHR